MKYVFNPFTGTFDAVGVSGAAVAPTQLLVDGGQAATVFQQYVLRLDFGSNGATINPTGNPNP